MAKNGFWRLGIAAVLCIGCGGLAVVRLTRPAVPDSIIERVDIPAGLATICGADKDGLMLHMNIILYDSQGKYLMQNSQQTPYACMSIADMKPGAYWIRLFRGDK